jgi:hypothetical protein
MAKVSGILLLISAALLGTLARAQTPSLHVSSTVKRGRPSSPLHLTPVDTVQSTSEVATGFVQPIPCDEDGNIYVQSDEPAASVRKLSPKGERVGLFQPLANPDVKVQVTGYFALAQDGELYTLAFPENEFTRYVLVFKPDGSYKTKIKLDPGFPWLPATLAVFPNGNLLVTGQEYVKPRDMSEPMLPFTGIFSSDGSLLKEVEVRDDEKLEKMGAARDSRVTSSTNPQNNRAISWGQAAAAGDGNVYVMRWLSPAVFYAISPGGEVVKTFEVDPGNSNLEPASMHISANRIAVLFFNSGSEEEIMKLVDLDGHEVASYNELKERGKAKKEIGLAFACYTSRPESFTFLTTGDDHRIQLQHVEPR